jgi:colicin import membrane protein
MSAVKNNSIGSPYRVPPEPSRLPAIVLAVTVHALLLAFLWIGVNWQNHQPVQVEAEVWDMKVQSAAPPPPQPVQETEPEPEPEPEPAPAPKVVEQPPPPAPAPDIRLEREKQRKEELRREKERELAEQKAREEVKAKELAQKKAKDEALKKELAKKEEAERKARELAEKKDAEKKEKAEKLAKEKAEKQAKAAEQAKRDALHKQELQRMMAQAGSGTNGTAAKSTAPRMDSGYLAAITAKIKSATIYSGSTDEAGNPTVSFRVEQLPTGEIISVKKVKSSGVPAFDDAVERGINKSSPLPKKKDGTVERSLEVFFHMKDLN